VKVELSDDDQSGVERPCEWVNPALFRAPNHLSTTVTPIRRVLFISACIFEGWAEIIQSYPDGAPTNFVHIGQMSETLPHPFDEYDFQVIQVPLRLILPEGAYFRLDLNDLAAFETLFQETCQRLETWLEFAMQYNRRHKLLSFIANYPTPIQNPRGRLMPRYNLNNFTFFFERLNQCVDDLIKRYENAHLLDIDSISASLGKMHLQDDFLWTFSHGSFITDWDHPRDQNRIQPPKTVAQLYQGRLYLMQQAFWAELVASYRTLRQIDSVKMVVMDLDDTLWRGVMGEAEAFTGEETEGWPLGVTEALLFLKARGVILSIVSKNDETTVQRVWQHTLAGRLEFSDFAFRRINWLPKAENIREIIEIANILPSSVVFVDDNPVERAAVRAALPGVRAIGMDPYLTRRILLWSSETQVAAVTEEGGRRTEMMQQQAVREDQRRTMPREEFLSSLQVQVRMVRIDSTEHPNFPRVLELINKTNQFNTTGRRWQRDELWRWLDDGKRISAFVVEDRFTQYGLVGVVLHDNETIEQWVMSCRVLGMEVEIAILAMLLRDLAAQGVAQVRARIVETPANFPCRDFYHRGDFTESDGVWFRETSGATDMASHVKVLDIAAT
jgi:FkbH-like protein